VLRFVELFQKEIASLILSLATLGMGYLFRARVQLIWSSPHSFMFLISPPAAPAGQEQAPAFNIHTASIFVQNSGSVPATEIELTFNWQPPNFNIWPLRPFTEHKHQDGRFTLQFPNLAPKEHLQVELVANGQLPNLMSVRSKECVGKAVQMAPMRTVRQWILYLRAVLIILGITSVFYFLIRVLGLLF